MTHAASDEAQTTMTEEEEVKEEEDDRKGQVNNRKRRRRKNCRCHRLYICTHHLAILKQSSGERQVRNGEPDVGARMPIVSVSVCE